MSALHSICTGTDAQFTSLQHLLDANKSMVRFKAVVTKKYADQGKPMVDGMGDSPIDDMSKSLQTADFKIDGDNATMVVKISTDKNPPKFHKDGSRWKLDLAGINANPDQERQGIAAAKAFDALSDKVEAGKYKDFNEFALDAQVQLNAAMGGH